MLRAGLRAVNPLTGQSEFILIEQSFKKLTNQAIHAHRCGINRFESGAGRARNHMDRADFLGQNSRMTSDRNPLPGVLIRSAALAALLHPPAALASGTTDWATEGVWDVSFYTGTMGCQAYALFDDGTAFFIGFDTRGIRPQLDIILADRSWEMITPGAPHEVTVKFGDESPWVLSMQGVTLSEFPGLAIHVDARSEEAALFIDEFQRENAMSWILGGAALGRYTLRGSRRAFDAVIACQAAHSQGGDMPPAPVPEPSLAPEGEEVAN